MLNPRFSIGTTIVWISTIFIIVPAGALVQSNIQQADFMIKDFGIINGNPWIIVEGRAGGSIPQNASVIYTYVFVTDNGTYAVMSHAYEDTDEVENDTQWHTHRITLDNKNCIVQINDNGDTQVNKDLVKVTNVIVRNISKVFTAEMERNSIDSSICVKKIFDSAP
jgi:hypothetical protein